MCKEAFMVLFFYAGISPRLLTLPCDVRTSTVHSRQDIILILQSVCTALNKFFRCSRWCMFGNTLTFNFYPPSCWRTEQHVRSNSAYYYLCGNLVGVGYWCSDTVRNVWKATRITYSSVQIERERVPWQIYRTSDSDWIEYNMTPQNRTAPLTFEKWPFVAMYLVGRTELQDCCWSWLDVRYKCNCILYHPIEGYKWPTTVDRECMVFLKDNRIFDHEQARNP
jgi:hypothetical protein